METINIMLDGEEITGLHFFITEYATMFENLAVLLVDDDGEFWSDVTVNLPGYLVEENEAFVNVNAYSDVVGMLEKYEIAKPTGVKVNSGFVTYPLYKFDMDKLLKYGTREEVVE